MESLEDHLEKINVLQAFEAMPSSNIRQALSSFPTKEFMIIASLTSSHLACAEAAKNTSDAADNIISYKIECQMGSLPDTKCIIFYSYEK